MKKRNEIRKISPGAAIVLEKSFRFAHKVRFERKVEYRLSRSRELEELKLKVKPAIN